jgi:bifunctional non-homologous end joining protein LigD
MALETYNAKRNFARTAEPKGELARTEGHSFVIQKHAATRLHYDFRLEMDGVLKSWAVTRGPSFVPGEKRLAVHVEDHPLDYGGFEGNIPKGEYGGGSVIVWDRGRWEPVGDPHKAYRKGHMEFELDGEKLHGRWHLIRMAHRTGEKHDNWLLIKGDDDYARSEDEPDILEEAPDSVLTGRAIEDLEGEAPGWSSKTGRIDNQAKPNGKKTPASNGKTAASRKAETTDSVLPVAAPTKIRKARKGALPDFIEPELATLVPKPPTGKRWLHEVKFDGYRLQVRIEAGRAKLFTRSGLDWTRKFGKDLLAGFAALPVSTAMIDGELVVENSAGSSDFSALQEALSEGRTDKFKFYAFDLLHLDGTDLTATPLIDRKAALQRLLAGQDAIRYSDHFGEEGDVVLQHACRLSLEGIVSKLRDAPYRPGRGRDWLKSKCSSRQEFVIAGYVPSTASRNAIGSLVMGVYQDGKLHHVGRVGTGYTARVAEDLYDQLERIRIDKSPFGEKLTSDEARGVRYVQPKLVAEVEFRAWTADGNLRHAAFRGLREDKPAKEIVREDQAAPKSSKMEKPAMPSVKLTHPDRLYWPDEGVTKEGLANYYTEIWPLIGPFIIGRPLALLRAPEGVGGEMFFQKHSWRGMNKKIELVDDPQETNPDDKLIMISDLDGLIGLVQSAVLEIHPWGSTIKDIEHPDMIIMDLDPGEGVPWSRIIEAAYEVKKRLEDEGLAAFVKTSGGKGLHVVSPVKPKADWDAVKDFCHRIADAMAKDDPDHYVATITKSKRHGKILVDYLRNGRGNTAVAPYSTRARKGAAVSMPLAWEELNEAIGPAYFTVMNTPARIASLKEDPWKDFRAAAKPIKAGK